MLFFIRRILKVKKKIKTFFYRLFSYVKIIANKQKSLLLEMNSNSVGKNILR